MSVDHNLQLIHQNIATAAKKAARKLEDIQLITVSKTRSVQEVETAIELGENVFGENTIQDAMTKITVMGSSDCEWHFIGHLQSKKAKYIPNTFSWIHTIDSIKLAEKLSTEMMKANATSLLNCLIQVNVSGESSKSGIAETELETFIERLLALDLPGLTWRGLMTIGVKADENVTRHVFAVLRERLNQCRVKFNLKQFDQLSMGMSGDYQIAIEEGATMIRLGSSIFGLR